MAKSSASRSSRPGRVSFLQLVTAIAGFFVFSVMGGVLVAGLVLPAATVAGQAAAGGEEVFESLPEEFANTSLPETSYIYASDGTTLLATFYDQNRQVVQLENISPWMQKAQVAIEDKRFWDHGGVDGEGLLRVAYLMASGGDTQGASTITQQLVKNMLLQAAVAAEDEEAMEAATETTVARKVREWRLALGYEERLNQEYGTACTADPAVDCGKDQVLESYLNIAQYGPSVYGVEAASELYFGISAKELNAIQAATIAGITQNPSKWDPLRNPENAEFRRNLVLAAMNDQGELTDAEYELLRFIPIETTLNVTYPKFSCAASELAPFFCNYVTKIITNDPTFDGKGGQLLYKGGLKIVTTLDVTMQTEATRAVTSAVPPTDASGLENALVALDNTTGNILAMAQNRDFDPTSTDPTSTAINYSVDRIYGGSRGFSPGSSFKTIILTEWLNSGRALRQVVSGEQRKWQLNEFTGTCPEAGGFVGTWEPGNIETSANRQTTVLDATAYSINTAYVAMTQQLDLCGIRDTAQALGFQRADGAEFEIVPSMALGSQNASPLTMASVYQTLANGGVHCEPRAILSITELDGSPVIDSETGETVEPPPVSCAQAVSREVADGVTEALTKVFEYGSAKRVDIGRPAAGKTGTAQNNTHLWFVGYTPQVSAAVWVGNAEGDIPIHGFTINGVFKRFWYGGDIAPPIWGDFMGSVMGAYPVADFNPPSATVLNGVQVPVPDVSGMTEDDAQFEINKAGFIYQLGPETFYRPDLPVGTIVSTNPVAGTTLTMGSTVTYYKSTDQYPGWWYNWPSGWDPLTPPSDYWGNVWPPSNWLPNNPSIGWDPTPDVQPTPGPGGGTP